MYALVKGERYIGPLRVFFPLCLVLSLCSNIYLCYQYSSEVDTNNSELVDTTLTYLQRALGQFQLITSVIAQTRAELQIMTHLDECKTITVLDTLAKKLEYLAKMECNSLLSQFQRSVP